MARGIILHFNAADGFGEIRQSLSGEVLFVHESAVTDPGMLPLVPEQVVYFDVLEGSHGRQAVDVRLANGKGRPAGGTAEA